MIRKFNERLGLLITRAVGTMWCAYGFAVLALVSLPAAIQGGVAALIQWTAQTFIQLVLLSIILVGQDIQSRITDAKLTETHDMVREEIGLIRDDHSALAGLVKEIHSSMRGV